jgi:hypothetical protein
MKKIYTLLLLISSAHYYGQVGIGTTTPSNNAILELNSTNSGLLLPRMTSAQRTAISASAISDKGLQVFDTTTNSLWFWNGTAWIEQDKKNIYDANGDISSSVTTNRAVDFSNGGSLNLDSNTLYIDATNNRVGIGTNAPSNNLEINGTGGTGTGLKLPTGASNGKVLSSDASGNTTWVNNVAITPTVIGVLNTGTSNIPFSTPEVYTGSYIDLPPGKWSVNATMLVNFSSSLSSGQGYWIRSGFSLSSSSFVGATYLTSSTLISGAINPPVAYGILTGTVLINNTNASTTRYYYWRLSTDAFGGASTSNNLVNFACTSWGENQIIAYPIN